MDRFLVATAACVLIFPLMVFAERPQEPSGGFARTELLWPGGAPGAKGDGPADKPCLFVYPAREATRVKTAVVVCPGGAYVGHAMEHEGRQVAEWLNSLGVDVFVLRYRLAPYRHPVPLGDARRAVQLVRARAGDWGIDPQRIGIMGFSAGGHLASTAGTHFQAGSPDAADAIERVSSRPDFMILCYPVITFSEPWSHNGSMRNLLGPEPDPALVALLSNEKQVTAETPPTFLFHTSADKGVPPENSVFFYLALQKAKVPVEMHIFERGAHGVGLATKDPALAVWPKLCAEWMRSHGWLTARE